MTSRKNADIQDYLAKFKVASDEAQAAISSEIKSRLEKIFKNEKSKNRQIAEPGQNDIHSEEGTFYHLRR